jgi:malate dehydrogenase (oxaloacetate-decarboxylating)(NADP+)
MDGPPYSVSVAGGLNMPNQGIPIGKLALYVACAGLRPEKTLPVLLDTGTDNEGKLNE